ncbi:N-acetyltransferase GCN5 [Thalassotalea loyana]|uniref:N-acetyltransferase GCN5 n=1 Tax=Thalassotalea loyana TaxID=280483 RepID=A0ABQ6H9L6_9GAMM|nr:GNAT family N-acetyltransferase [Thalassotalea loyana]GLX84821.1 N-acetyltransferase GCN5 [Thalassotalea loyana]
MSMINTPRLYLREMRDSDAPFIHKLYNQADFIKYIGDKGIEDLDSAVDYIKTGPTQSYKEHGFGLLLVSLHDDTPIGVCGLLQREDLPFPDLGYAVDEQHYQKGFTKEACAAVLAHYTQEPSVLAVTDPENIASNNLLMSLGFVEYPGVYKGWGDSKVFRIDR